jgi:hypothetical protein
MELVRKEVRPSFVSVHSNLQSGRTYLRLSSSPSRTKCISNSHIDDMDHIFSHRPKIPFLLPPREPVRTLYLRRMTAAAASFVNWNSRDSSSSYQSHTKRQEWQRDARQQQQRNARKFWGLESQSIQDPNQRPTTTTCHLSSSCNPNCNSKRPGS